MKRSLLIIITALLSWQCYAQIGQNIPGPVTIRKAGKFITLDVTDTTMIDMNNRIKIYQTGDTLYVLTKTHQILAKFAPDTVWFATGPGYSGVEVFTELIYAIGGITLDEDENTLFGTIGGKLILTDIEYPEGVYLDSLVNKISGSGGSGEIDSLGNPAKYQVMIWTEPNKIGGYTNFKYKSDSVFTMNVIQGYDQVSIKTDMQDNGSKNYIALQSYDVTNGKSSSLAVQTENNYSDVTVTSNLFRINSDSARIDGKLRITKWGTLPDTMALVVYMDGRVDTISIAFGSSAAWEENLKPFPLFYWQVKRAKTLPQFKEVNTGDALKKIEWELERLYRYLWHFWIGGVLIICFVVYQQFQIRKLKKK